MGESAAALVTKALYRRALTWTVHHRWVMVARGAGRAWLAASGCCTGGAIGSEFLPHLDEGSIWAFGTPAPSIGPDDGTEMMNRGAHRPSLPSRK